MFTLQLSETHEMIRDTARQFAREEVAPSSIERDKAGVFPTDIV